MWPPHRAFLHHDLHHIEPTLDGRHVQKGLFEPLQQEAGPRRRAALVEETVQVHVLVRVRRRREQVESLHRRGVLDVGMGWLVVVAVLVVMVVRVLVVLVVLVV